MSENIETDHKKVLVLGLGGQGVRILNELKRTPSAGWLYLTAVDTDRTDIVNCLADDKMCISADWSIRDGVGCGGDIIRGERALARERGKLAQLMEHAELVILTGGLGGGTCTGGAHSVISVARYSGIPAVCLLTTPFSFESYPRRKNADDCIKDLLAISDIVINIPNDLLFSTLPPNTPVEQAFAESSKQMAGTVAGIANVLRSKELIGADYATFMNALHGKHSTCGVGVGFASANDGLDRCAMALDKMIKSPLLAGLKSLEKCDAALITVTAGDDLQFAELKRTLETASSFFPDHVNLIAGVNTSPAMHGSIQTTVVSIRYSDRAQAPKIIIKPKPEPKESSPSTDRKRKPREDKTNDNDLFQTEFQWTCFSKGIFEKYPAAMHNDEDLDVPSFQRENITIDKGE